MPKKGSSKKAKKPARAKGARKKKRPMKARARASAAPAAKAGPAPLKTGREAAFDTAPTPLAIEDTVASEVIRRVREVFAPLNMSLSSQTQAHRKHRHGGGGHYVLSIVSELFVGLSKVQRQRWINDLLGDLLKKRKIHALQLDLKDPTETQL